MRRGKRGNKPAKADETPKQMFSAIVNMLMDITSHSEDQWNAELEERSTLVNDEAKELYGHLQTAAHPVQSDEISNIIDSPDALSLVFDRPFCLPPLTNNSEFIPLMMFRCWLEDDPPRIDLRVGLIARSNNIDFETHGAGVRFETAHKSGNHDYDHVQLCSSPFKDNDWNDRYIRCPKWIPDHWPAFVLPSKNPVALLASMLVSFYGKSILRIFSDVRIEDYIKGLGYILDLTKKGQCVP